MPGILQAVKTLVGGFVSLIREDGTAELCEVVPAGAGVERQDVAVPVPAGVAQGLPVNATVDVSAFGSIGADDRFWLNGAASYPADGAPFVAGAELATPTTVTVLLVNAASVATAAGTLPATMFVVRG